MILKSISWENDMGISARPQFFIIILYLSKIYATKKFSKLNQQIAFAQVDLWADSPCVPSSFQDSDADVVSQALRDSQVLLSRTFNEWDWDLIVAILKVGARNIGGHFI